MTPIEELVEAFTNAGLTFGRPPPMGYPELRVRSASGREYAIKCMRYSFVVEPTAGPVVAVQCLTAEAAVEIVRNDAA